MLIENKKGLEKQPVWVRPWDHSGEKQTQITLSRKCSLQPHPSGVIFSAMM